MKSILTGTDIGRKNIYFGAGLFLLLGLIIGVPLTLSLFGVSVMSDDQYQIWKVVHGYGIFLSFINYFFGLQIDKLDLTRQQKEISSWSFILAGIFGGVIRGILVLLSSLDNYGLLASLGEVTFITIGSVVFLIGQISRKKVVST
jgi:hypothetical protein